jgi:peptidoglycan-associated lipoprotein
MHTHRHFLLGLVLGAAVIAGAGCTPDYPSCDTDKNCHEKEFCVEHKCQQCRDSKDCPAGQSCNAGKCERIPGYCRNKSECPAGQECIANKCKACASDRECPSGSYCVKGTCSSKKACKTEDDCAQNEDCVDGFCVAERVAPPPPPKECVLEPVYFDFNESALTTEATSRLAADAECLKKVGRAATLVGHTDPRGTQEYNLALSERRAQSVRDHLGRLGVEGSKLSILPRGSLDAKGTDEPSWAQDRRVDFTWR